MILTALNRHDLLNMLKQGDQILYVPSHLWEQDDFQVVRETNDWNSLDRSKWFIYPNGVQPGFVMNGPALDGSYFCRYWRYDYRQEMYTDQLRTVANSESTPGGCLFQFTFMSKHHVKAVMKKIMDEQYHGR